MTYYEAALRVLEAAEKPLTTKEITAIAIIDGLIAPSGKTPIASMAAVLYTRLRTDDKLVMTSISGAQRAKRGTVRWSLRKAVDEA